MDRLFVQIGERMRARRRQLRLTQAQVAEAAGIDASFYGQLERGANVPSVKTLLAVAGALETVPGELLPSRGAGRVRYAEEIERLVQDLDPGKRRWVLDIVGDMVHRLRRPRK